MTTTNNMGLVLPDPSVTLGPDWAVQLNAALALLDTHDHSTGKGVKVTPAGFNFTADLPCAGFKLTDCGVVGLRSLVANLTTAGSLHIKNGDLYHVSSNGTAVQITSGTGLNLSSTGTIGGDFGSVGVTASATYTDSLKTFSWLQASGISAKMFMGDILLTYPGAGENSVTLKAQTGSAAYPFSFPLAQATANDQVMAVSTAGVALFKSLTGTTNQVVITSSAGALTFSLPQNIHTSAAPTFSGLTLTGGLVVGTTASITGNLTAANIVTAGLVDGVDVSAFYADYTAKVSQNLTTAGSPTFVGLTLTGLTADTVVTLNSSKVAASRAYVTAATPNTIPYRDASGDCSFNQVNAATLAVSGYSTLGTGSPAFAIKKLSGSVSASPTLNSIAHGLSLARIKGAFGSLEVGGAVRLDLSSAATAGLQWDATHVKFTVPSSGTVEIYLVYEAS